MADLGETPRGFLKHAQEFYSAAELVLNDSQDISLPAYFLLGRSLELSLKAFLLDQGVSITELRSPKKFGHDLRALLREAFLKGIDRYIKLEPIEKGVIELLSYDYGQKRLEYRRTGGAYSLPRIDVAQRIARKLAYELQSSLTAER
jgi:HEPN domain-containing protein